MSEDNVEGTPEQELLYRLRMAIIMSQMNSGTTFQLSVQDGLDIEKILRKGID